MTDISPVIRPVGTIKVSRSWAIFAKACMHIPTLGTCFADWCPLLMNLWDRPDESPLQCAREQMGIRANGNLAPKFIASYSRANGNSSKWECSQKNHAEWLKMGTFLVKWDSFEHSNTPKHQNGNPKFFASYSRANGNSSKWEYSWNFLYFATKWDPICSRAYCRQCFSQLPQHNYWAP